MSSTGAQCIAIGSGGHTVVMDAPNGRSEWAGFKPSELLLAALLACTGVDFTSILVKQRQVVTAMSAAAHGEQDQEPPWAFRQIEVVFTVHGPDLDQRRVDRALALAVEHYCSVGATFGWDGHHHASRRSRAPGGGGRRLMPAPPSVAERLPRAREAHAAAASTDVANEQLTPLVVGRSPRLQRLSKLTRSYPRPLAMLVLLPLSLALDLYRDGYGDPLALVVIAVGALPLIQATIAAMRERRYALDYLALLAIAAAIAAGQFQVGAVIALMLASGRALEDYGVRRARGSLSMLADRIPRTALVQDEGDNAQPVPIDEITMGATVLVRHGEVLPLDGELLTAGALVDESSLTGEPYLLDKVQGDALRSGTMNQGVPLVMRVTREARDSTYRQILALVEAAQGSGAPMVRLADHYSMVFSAVAVALAGGAWWFSGSLDRALAVLVVATPCPLILGVPIALIGGVNRAANQKIIVKRLASLEVLARVTSLILDKTGTLTVGRPDLVRTELDSTAAMTADEALALAAAVERHSLHPIARALVKAAQTRSLAALPVHEVVETVGHGIQAEVKGRQVMVRGAEPLDGEMRVVCEVDGHVAATFVLEDRIKADAARVFERIQGLGIEVAMATGDRLATAERVVRELGLTLRVEADCTPKAKLDSIKTRQASGQVVGMVGDGINDAPALAQADVRLVFTHEARTASSEAADIVLLGGELEQVWQALDIARGTARVATQGVLIGIGLSGMAMLAAAAGFLPPLLGAFLQEGIDVLVIANALRATTGNFGFPSNKWPRRQTIDLTADAGPEPRTELGRNQGDPRGI